MDFDTQPISISQEILKTEYSRVIREDCKFSWRITSEEIDYSMNKPELKERYLVSSEFPSHLNKNFKWCMKLYLYKNKNGAEVFSPSLSLFLTKTSQFFTRVHAEGFILVIDPSYTARYAIDHYYSLTKEDIDYEPTDIVNGLYCNLFKGHVVFNINICTECETNYCHTNHFISEQLLLNNFFSLLKHGLFTDVTIFTKDNSKFRAHSCILAARSKVFAIMLQNEKKSSSGKIVIVEDCSGLTMKIVLNFIYCCKVQLEDWDTALDLLDASEKYELMDLKRLCLEYLWLNIDPNNACDLLVIADLHNSPELKNNIMQYLMENKKIFSDPNSYREILVKAPQLLVEIIANLVKGL